MTSPQTGDRGRITREDLDSTLRSVVGEVEQQAAEGVRRFLPVAAGVGVGVLLLAYLLGRRAGIKKSTVVEIRRI